MKRVLSGAMVSAAILTAAVGLAPRPGATDGGSVVVAPTPAAGLGLSAKPSLDTAVFAGGCFWGIEGVYEHVKGVLYAESGYAGGSVVSPSYEQVSSGDTGHAESVRVVFDPSKVSYGQLLQIFFSVAHDPTQLNRQGPDHGTQYRSAIFYRTPQQKQVAEAYVAQLTAAKTYSHPIVTQIAPLHTFYLAESYHQDYMAHNPRAYYIVVNDAPKVEHLREQFPALYKQ
jgi:peptide-methionine (S)-S-oxide reductase